LGDVLAEQQVATQGSPKVFVARCRAPVIILKQEERASEVVA
jgi:hypothetical protein